MEAAVVSSTEGVLRILLGKLGDVVASKYALVCGVHEEIQELKDDLESMNACLRDLAAGSDDNHSEQTKTWMKQVREVAYDAEDYIDTFRLHHRGHHRDYYNSNLVMVSLHRIIRPLKTLRAMHGVAKKIRDLKARAMRVSERRLRYKVETGGGATFDGQVVARSAPGCYNDWDRRLPALNIDESQLVWSEETAKYISSLERDDSAPRKVVSIVGSGGLGKTTLALTVYNSPMVKGIPTRAFVAVSQNYDLHILLQSLLTQLVGNAKEEATKSHLRDVETWEISKLITECNTHLQHKRYFIVLDDLWSSEAWKHLKAAFPYDTKQSSRILITTRSHHVAESCSSHTIYKMDPLPEKESKELLFKRVFQKNECPKELEGICQSIVQKCGGLPLAIVSVGGMLSRMENKTAAEWAKMQNRLSGYELEPGGNMGGMRRILSLSYNDLPYHLKACFLYLSIFPESYEIKRGPLVRQWVAEGFIGGTHESNMEKVAESHFAEFVSRSIVTPTRIATTGVVRACKAHDIMLEVITYKSIQENFISFVGNQQYMAAGHDKIRRLSIRAHGSGSSDKEKEVRPKRINKEHEDRSMNFSHARSLSILRCKNRPLPMIRFAKLKLLRVLDLEGCKWLSEEDLKEICKLSLLRYLSLRGTSVSQLPEQVGKLKELLTLDVRETSITKLPKTITQLGSLKHLLGGRYVHYPSISRVKALERNSALIIPRGLKKMKSLQKIAHLDIGSSSLKMEELGDLSQVTKLCAINNEPGGEKWKPFVASLSKMCDSIRHLSIIQSTKTDKGLKVFWELKSTPVFLEKLYLWGTLKALPPWVLNHSNLVDLSLRENFLGRESLKQLGDLPCLLSLRLYSESYVGEELCFKQNKFPSLKQLIIDNLSYLEKVSFQGGATRLERLALAFFKDPGAEGGICGIKELPKLKEIEFFGGVIVDSLVETVRSEVKEHPNKVRVYMHGQPIEHA
ncbi:unnamed protein product [Urochloa decumbens]|uniref:Uncharacterized protein n=1 Tax=Urochloa decumbens TaxID=240449 RepID=A0ABC8ZP85_9POAL